jgi:hypothetical protein
MKSNSLSFFSFLFFFFLFFSLLLFVLGIYITFEGFSNSATDLPYALTGTIIYLQVVTLM